MISPAIDAQERDEILDRIRDDRRALVDRLLAATRARVGQPSFGSSLFAATFLDRVVLALEGGNSRPLTTWAESLAAEDSFESESSRLISICCAALTDEFHRSTTANSGISAYFTLLAVEIEAAFTNTRLRRVVPDRKSSVERSSVLNAFLRMIRAHDASLCRHAMSVSSLAARIGTELGLNSENVAIVRESALLHDIGKIAIPPSILLKPGPLTEAEWIVMKQHPAIGAGIIGAMPEFATHARIVACHHERVDATGYPAALAGKHIPAEAKIVSAADSFHAMITDRPYKAAMPIAAAINEVQRCAGTQFDSTVVAALCALVQPAIARKSASLLDSVTM